MKHFYNDNNNQIVEWIVTEPVTKCKSNWEPKKNYHTVEIFVEAVENNVASILREKKYLLINYFTKRHNTVITKAEKEEANVILNVEKYATKVNHYLGENIF